MSNSFDPSIGSPLSRARFLLGDTNEDAIGWLLADETINALLAQFPFSEGVAQLALGLASRFAQEPDWYDDEGGVRVRWNSRIKAWQTLAQSLRTGEGKTELNATGLVYGAVTQGQVLNQPAPGHATDSFGNRISRNTPSMRF